MKLCRFRETDKKGKTVLFDADEHVRAETTLESLAKLPPVFSGSGGQRERLPREIRAGLRMALRRWC